MSKKKFVVVCRLLEAYGHKALESESASMLIVESLSEWSAEEIERASPVMMRRHKFFNIPDFEEVLYEIRGVAEDKKEQKEVKWNKEQFDAWLSQIESLENS